MSASPVTAAMPSTKRPLEDPSSPSGPTDQPDAKRPALDKIAQGEVSGAAPDGVGFSQTVTGEGEVVAPEIEPVGNGVQRDGEDIKIEDAPVDEHGSQNAISNGGETHAIQSTTGNDRSSGTPSGHQDESSWVHIRAVISSAEAATVIGKGGENVTQIRRLSGAKCTVSDYTRGAVERILTVSGLVDATAKVSLTCLSTARLTSED